MPYDFNGRSLEEVRRYYLWRTCEDKQSLHDWIQAYLGIDLPDCIVSADSNSSPMDMVWEMYIKSIVNDPEFYRVMYYANRGGGKTLGASIFEAMAILHLERSVIHMAALGQQSEKAQEYLKGFFRMPHLRDFVVGDNAREIVVVRWFNPITEESLSQKEYQDLLKGKTIPIFLPRGNLGDFQEKSEYARIIMATVRSTNGEHAPLLCADEVDIIQDLAAYEEAKNIPEPRNGKQPITFLISTRKYAFGMVQKEIDDAHKTGLQIRHWNAIDMAQACPADRHLPENPQVPIYRCDDTLVAIDEEAWLNLSGPEQSKYVKEQAFEGCLKNCKIYAACKGRLATHQTGKSTMLKPISHLTSQLRVNSLEMRKAQILCLKPASTGLIYGSLSRSQHLVRPEKVYEFITGETTDNPHMTKAELLALALEKDCPFYAGMDFGYSHNFAVVCGFVFGNRMFITHSIAMPELEPHQQVDICRPLQRFSPAFFPDMENPQMIKVFSKAGFRMRNWQKGKGSVLGGIDIMRMKINPGGDRPPEVFLVKDEEDPSIDYLFEMLQRYHWKIGADGQPSDVPDDADDDSCDACRYLIMNVFSAKGKVSVSAPTYDQSGMSVQYNPNNWMRQVIDNHVQDSDGYSYYEKANDENNKKQDAPIGKKGSILWDMS